ncbi:MAG: hypothetical protein MK538_18130 [Planctomycetes bacterium]|nr:hypothetical protein [Planctomycetota bacterium]
MAVGSFREFEEGCRFIGGIAEILVFDAVDDELRDEVNEYLVKKYVTGNPATECSGSNDPTSACCTGATCHIQSQADCEAGGGVYQGDGAPCEVASCGPQPTTGACCTGVNCDTRTQSSCEAGGGTYQGDDSVCDVGLCDTGGPLFRRGDHDGSCLADITDALNLLGFLFLGTTPPICDNASDFDNSGLLDITDALILLGHLFLGQPNALPVPGTACGENPTTPQPGIPPIPPQEVSDLGCETYPGPAFPGAACP